MCATPAKSQGIMHVNVPLNKVKDEIIRETAQVPLTQDHLALSKAGYTNQQAEIIL